MKSITLNDKVKLVNALFENYSKITNEIELLKIALDYTQKTEIGDEMTSLALRHPTEPNQSGKSNVREVSRKTENIALSVKDNLKNEAQSHYDRITLLENIKRQIDFYVSSLDEFSSHLFRLKYVEGKAVKQICDILSDKARQYSEWSIHDRIKKITLNFLAITPLSEFQMKHALER